MRKLISGMLTGVILAGLSIGISGCTDETGTKEEIKVTTPGGTSKETRDLKVQKSGENPPPVPSDKKIP